MENWLKKIEDIDKLNEVYQKELSYYTINFCNVCKRVNDALGRLQNDILRRNPIENISPDGAHSGAGKEFIYNKHGRDGRGDLSARWTYNQISFSRFIKFDLVESNLIITAYIYSSEGIYEDDGGPTLIGNLFHPFSDIIIAKSTIDASIFMKLNETEYLKICDWLIYKCDSSGLSLPGSVTIISTNSESNLFNQRIKENPLRKENACFIATACYGEFSNEVLFLRAFRNKVLVSNSLGRTSIKIYYKSAPYISKILRKYYLLNWVTKYLVLTPIILILKKLSKPLTFL